MLIFVVFVVNIVVSAWKMTKKMAMAKNELAVIDGSTTESAEKNNIYMVENNHTHTHRPSGNKRLHRIGDEKCFSLLYRKLEYGLYGQRDATSIRHF